ncbi:hypothetical protein CHS0354_013286 [Potamilus streckersoni]|uniref:Adenosine 3'-phospho 5'-phosphosulfate transporter 1 n=1 Tax=Potamilus streckersoni TaxID=2493646 RepID=A0AAE0SZF1_9BIVA|nr:hypothetical protein CHS0354_013286 [Potamilus streckersoni]
MQAKCMFRGEIFWQGWQVSPLVTMSGQPWALMKTAIMFLSLVLLNFILPYVLGEESTGPGDKGSLTDFWFVRLALNLLGYGTIFVPGYFLIQYFRKVRFNDTAGPGCIQQLVKLCIFGKESERLSLEEGGTTASPSRSAPREEMTLRRKAALLMLCFFGLQGSYLTWGVLQERVMTYEYGGTDGTPGEHFKNSQFLVFINRILAFIVAMSVLLFQKQPRHIAPLYKYSYSSFSNIMSSWCQYEALKFVSFPTQVLAKACKVIPVMLMGKIVSKKSYGYDEYVTALMISVGVSLFLLTSGEDNHRSTITTLSGLILLVGYMAFDSFTSNWQDEIFNQYHMSSIQMMAGVNMFSCLLTSVSLIEQGGFVESLAFMARNPAFIAHSVMISLSSACGQLFIFYTIEKFGAVTFTIIMTLRQAFAILLSCVIYGHPVTIIGFLGVFIVFIALFLKIYASQRKKSLKSTSSSLSASPSKG